MSFVDLRDGLIGPDEHHEHDACDGTLEYLFSEAKLREVCGGKAGALRAKAQLAGRPGARRRAAVDPAHDLGRGRQSARAGSRGPRRGVRRRGVRRRGGVAPSGDPQNPKGSRRIGRRARRVGAARAN